MGRTPDEKPARDRLWTRQFVWILTANCVVFTSLQVLVPVLPLYVAEILGGNEATVGLAVGTLTFTAVLVRPVFGWVIDQHGRKVIVLICAALFGATGLLYPLAASLTALIAVRFVQGIGWSGIPPATSTMAADLVPSSRRGEGIAFVSTSQSVAMAVGPAIGLFVAGALGYTPAFLAAAALAFLAFALALFTRDRYVPPKEKRGFGARDIVERSSVVPSAVCALLTFVFGGLTAFIPLDALERDLGDPAVFFVAFSVVLIVVRPVTGRLSDRQARRGMLLLPGIGLVAASLFVLAFTESAWTLAITALLWALGFGVAQPVLRAMVLDLAPRERWGSANATLGSAYDLGMASGALVLGIVASRTGIPAMFAYASLAMALAFVLILWSGLYRA